MRDERAFAPGRPDIFFDNFGVVGKLCCRFGGVAYLRDYFQGGQ
jgi:hypothetical protein